MFMYLHLLSIHQQPVNKKENDITIPTTHYIAIVFYQLIAAPQVVAALGQSQRSTRLNLYFMYNFDTKILVSCWLAAPIST